MHTSNSIGNLLTRNNNNGNVTYAYNDPAHKHAVTQIGSQYFCYDANGNMLKRGANTTTYVGVYPERREGTVTGIA